MTGREITIRKMTEYDHDMSYEISNVFVDGYYKDLSFFTKDRERLKEAFRDSFCTDVFYLAEMDGRIVGILACCGNGKRALKIEKTPMEKKLGFIMGSLAYRFLKSEFNLPTEYPEDTAYIESVATLEEFRGKGVSMALMRHVMEKLPYRRYVLEVVDTNENAHRLYQKLGFSEFRRKREKHPKIKGYQEKIYMEWRKKKPVTHGSMHFNMKKSKG